MEIQRVGDGNTVNTLRGGYENLEGTIYCGTDPELQASEVFGACASPVFKDALTGTVTTDINESTDTEFDACNKVVGGSTEKGWYSPSTGKEELKSGGWVGSRDYVTPATAATVCPGVWTVVYKFTQTFKNNETLTAESSGTFKVSMSPGGAGGELYGGNNPAYPNYVQACAGKPVDCATGNETVSQTDVSVGGRGVPLTFTRTYNSQAAVSQTSPGLLGYGWSSSFDDYLSISSGGGVTTAIAVQANGSTVKFTGNGTPGPLTGPAWGQAKLVMNQDGTYTYTLPTQKSFHFNSSGLLLSEADRNGNTTTLNRNTGGRLESVTDAGGRKLTFTYNAEGLIESITDPMGHTAQYAYEGGNLASVTLPGETSPRWQFKYDSSHRMTRMTDGRGGATVNEYDTSNRVISQTDPAERKLTFEYGLAEHERPETKVTNRATGAVTREIFSSGYEPVSITRGFGTTNATTESLVYDSAGDLTQVTDGNGHVTKYEYDTEGNRIGMVDAAGHPTKWTYNATHDMTTMTTPLGYTTTYERNSIGQIIAISRPAPSSQTQVTKFTYDTQGDLESVTNPLGNTSKYEYDNYGDRTSETDPEGNKRTWEYNADSQEVATVSPRGNVVGGEPSKYTTKTERDAQGRVVAVTNPLGHTTKKTYDANGNVETETDANGKKTTYTYDADNEPIKVEMPNASITETGYDGAGYVTSQTDGNKHVTKYVRNVLGQVTEVIDPLGRKTLREYDKVGNIIKQTDAMGRTTTDAYDPLNHLAETVYSDTKTAPITYEYNADGMRNAMTDGVSKKTYQYDILDRLTRAIENPDGSGTVYEYDLANDLLRVDEQVRTYDKDGRIEKVTDNFVLKNTTAFSYDPDSNLAAIKFPTSTSNEDKYAYDASDQMSEVKMLKGAETLASIVYGRDGNGDITSTTSKGLPGEEKTLYSYDTNRRVTKAGTTTYEYDAANNLTKVGSSTYTYDAANELETGPEVKYTYDGVGERTATTPTSRGVSTTYKYDQAGNLVGVERPKEGGNAEIKDVFAYNGDHLLESLTYTGKEISYDAWNMTNPVPELLVAVYGPGGLPIEEFTSAGTPLYVHHDAQGSTRLITGATGSVEGSFTYDAYGNITGSQGRLTPHLGFQGEYTSSDTGLIYERARNYDPKTRQFLSADPVNELTREPYAYAHNNPLSFGDPTGLCNANPFSESFWTRGNCISESPLNPIRSYEKEIEAYEHGCGYAQSVAYGIEGAVFGTASLIPLDDAELRVAAWLQAKFPWLTAKLTDWIASDSAAKYGQPGWKDLVQKMVEYIYHHQ